MQFGAMNFPVIPVLQELEKISEMNFDYLELTMDPPMAHHTQLSAHSAEIRNALKERGLGLVCHLPTFVSTADLTDSLRKASVMEMCDSLKVASELGAEKAVVHPSAAAGMGCFVPETVKGYLFDFLSDITEEARKLPITLCLENMFPRNLLGVEPEDLKILSKRFPSLRFTLDTGHAHIGSRGNSRLFALVETLGERLAHLHFSDNHGVRDEHLALGEGSIDFPGLIKILKSIGYDETITLEIFDGGPQKLVDSRQMVLDLLAHA